MSLYKEDINRYIATTGCADPHCTTDHTSGQPFYIEASCHPGTKVTVTYSNFGVMTVHCGVCEKEVVEVFVASRADATKRGFEDFLFADGPGDL